MSKSNPNNFPALPFNPPPSQSHPSSSPSTASAIPHRVQDQPHYPPPPPPPPNRPMPGPTRTKVTKPPRPPNAWIIFRSEQVKLMPPTNPKPSLNVVSKYVSGLWNKLSPEEKLVYDKLAEEAKREHYEKYPDYRFQPMKREEKTRLRALEKKERQQGRQSKRARQSQPAQPPMYTPQQVEMMLAAYGTLGPSPPQTAAPSPASSITSSESNPTSSSSLGPSTPSAHPSSYRYTMYPAPPLYPTILTPGASTSQDSLSSPSSFPSASASATQSVSPVHDVPAMPSQWLPTQALHSAPLFPTVPSQSSHWNVDDNAAHESNTALPVPAQANTAQFDIPASSSQNFMSYLNSINAEESFPAVLGATEDQGVFELNLQPGSSLLENLDGPIAVSFGEVPYEPANMFEFGFSFEDLQNLASGSSDFMQQEFDPNSFQNNGDANNFDMDQYVNPGMYESTSTPSASTSEQQHESQESFAAVATPYTPPAGASQSSTRRVAATWQKSFAIPDSPVDSSPPRAWSVIAS